MNDAHVSEVVDAVIAVGAHLDAELDEVLRERGITRPTFLVLRELAAAQDGGLTQRDLAARLRRTAGTLSVRLGRLQRAGVIERDPHPGDRRTALVRLTDRGRELLERAEPAYDEHVATLGAGLPGGLGGLRDHLVVWLDFFEPGERQAARLGIAVAPSAAATRMRRAVGLPERAGVLVLRAAPDGPGARAGLGTGDLVTAAGGVPVRTVADLERALRRAEGRLVLDVIRGVERRTVEVALN